MYNMRTRILAMLLCCIMLIGCIPAISEEALGDDLIEEVIEAPESTVDGSSEEEPAEMMPSEDISSAEDPAITNTDIGTEAGSDPVRSIDEAVSDMIDAMKDVHLQDDYEKSLWLYDMLLSIAEPGTGDTAQDALINGKADSVGYAEAYALLMEKAGISCRVVRSADSSNTWNIINISGKWTHVNAHADDASGKFGHSFGLTDDASAQMFGTVSENIPACNDPSLNYNVRMKDYMVITNADDFRSAVTASKGTIHFYNTTAISSDDLLDSIADIETVYDTDGPYISVSPVTLENAQAALQSSPVILPVTTSYTLGVGDTRTIMYTVVPSNANVTFYTSSSSVCTVSSKGVITAMKTGTATITLAITGAIATINVKVVAGPTNITGVCERYNSSDRTIYVGKDETIFLDYKTTPASVKDSAGVTYTVSKPSIATITSVGELTGVSTGNTTVKLKCYNGVSVETKVAVVSAPTGILVTNNAITLGAGETDVCGTVIAGDTYGIFTPKFSTDDPSIATVNENTGKITAVSVGETDIIASTYNGKTAACHVTVVPAPQKLVINGAYTTIAVGDKLPLSYALLPEEASGSASWSSSNTKYATVSASGIVTAKKAGSVVITAKAYNGVSNTYSITIKSPVSKVNLKLPSAKIGLGESVASSYTLTGYTNSYVYTSADPETASIDENGIVTGNKTGETVLNLKAGKITSSGVKVEVMNAPASITASLNNICLAQGDTVKLSYALNEGSAGSVTWTSDNDSVASVSSTGVITANEKGTATITLSTYNGKTDTCTVTVTDAISSISLDAERTTIGIGETLQLNALYDPAEAATKLTYKASSTKYLTVSEDGVVKGKRAGTGTITVKTYNGLTSKISITIKKAPKSVKLILPKTEIGVGEKIAATVKFSAGTAGSIREYESDDPENGAAVIDADGIITGVHTGSVQFRCVSYNGKYSPIVELNVLPAPVSIKPESATVSIGSGDSGIVKYELSQGTAGSVSFTSDDPDICEIDPNTGVITAHAVGVTFVTMTTHNGKTARCNIVVLPSPDSVEITAPRVEIGVGEYVQLNTTIAPENAVTTCSYTSDKPSYAAVDSNGMVRGRAPGTAVITVTTHNGKTASVKIKVKKAPASVKFSAERTTIGVGEYLPTTITYPSGSTGSISEYTSDNKSVLTIDENGVIHGEKIGTASVYATAYNGVRSNKGTVTVAAAPSYITADNTELILGVSETTILGYTLPEGSAGAVTYASSDPMIAAVDTANGKITALSTGKCTITLTTYNGKTATCSVDIKEAPSSINLTAPRVTIGVGEKVALSVDIVPDDAFSNLTYTSSAKTVATVDADGIVTGKRAGTAVITATTYNGQSSSISFRILEAPSSLKLTQNELVIGMEESVDLSAFIRYTEGTACTLSYESYNSDICVVDPAAGILTGKAIGTTTVCVTTHNGLSKAFTIKVMRAPQSISLVIPSAIGVGQQLQVSSLIGPNEADHASFLRRYSCVEGSCINISDDGMITAKSAGTAIIRVDTYLPNVYDQQTITIKKAPTFLQFANTSYTLDVDKTLQLEPIIDNDAMASFTYTVTKAGYFTIDENGLVTPISRGTTTVTVKTHNGLSAKITITIEDPYFPESIDWTDADDNPPEYMDCDVHYGNPTSWIPQIDVTPSTAVAAMKWETSNEDILIFDTVSGAFVPVSYGTVTVKGTSTRNPSLTLSAKITVLSKDQYCLTTPIEYKSISNYSKSQIQNLISDNFAIMDEIRDSAFAELARLHDNGTIGSTEMDKRKKIINRAFAMLEFPWTTPSQVSYWISDYDKSPFNHSKDYRTNTLYFGIPYTQTYRKYNASNIVSEGWYADNSPIGYKLRTDKFSGRLYRGNDCSSFVSQSEWGSGHYDNTTSIAKSSSYTTLDKATHGMKMRPGDILVNSGHHVVMFLYYTNSAKTQFMIIEQGGSDDYHTNLVACRIKENTKYSKYTLRRPKL